MDSSDHLSVRIPSEVLSNDFGKIKLLSRKNIVVLGDDCVIFNKYSA